MGLSDICVTNQVIQAHMIPLCQGDPNLQRNPPDSSFIASIGAPAAT